MGLLRRLLSAWILAMVALAGGRFEVSTRGQACEEGCCCSDGTSCCASPSRIKITSSCGCGHDEGHARLDLSTIVMGPLEDAIGAAGVTTRSPAMPVELVPPGRAPSPEVPPPRVRCSDRTNTRATSRV